MLLLSEEVFRLIDLRENGCGGNFLLDDLTLNWTLVDELLQNTEKNLDDIETCRKLKEMINQIIICTSKILEHHERFADTLHIFGSWTSSVGRLEKIFTEFCHDSRSFALCGFLETTAIMEYALGNVYQTSMKSRPPHLLRDLLGELSSCRWLRENQTFILQIMLGTPKSCNLRNVAWHGFLDSLSPAYLAFMLVMIASLGKQFENQTVLARYRPIIQLKLEISWPEVNCERVLKTTPCNQHAWDQIQRLGKERNYTHGIFLLLSQAESALRFIYSRVNGEEDAVKAQLNKYYVIMDSIFYEYILSDDITPLLIGKITKIQEMEIRKTHRRNRMLEFMPRPIYLIYYDLFYAADGPRLRDKLSHGEVIIEESHAEAIFDAILKFTSAVVDFYNTQIVSENFFYDSKFMGLLKFVRSFNDTNRAVKNFFDSLKIPKALATCDVLAKAWKLRSGSEWERIFSYGANGSEWERKFSLPFAPIHLITFTP